MKERIKEHSDHIRLHSGLISDTRDQIYSRHSPGLINGTNRVRHSGIIISTQSASGSTQRSLVQALTVRHIFRRCEHIFNHLTITTLAISLVTFFFFFFFASFLPVTIITHTITKTLYRYSRRVETFARHCRSWHARIRTSVCCAAS
jgi:hypothetical protein